MRFNPMFGRHLISISATILFSGILFSCTHSKIADSRINQLIQAMTLEEKIDFIGGFKSFNIQPIERLGIPEIHMADGPVGVRNFGNSTAYPASINLAASWDKKLAYETGKSIAMEARAKNVHIMLGPGMNIYRSPLAGRNFEYLGEDPYLAGQIAKEYIVGMQDQGVVATAKHFAANNQEYDRNHVSSDMDERTLHEIYLPAFKTAVQEGKVAAVMTSYNPVNGVQMSQNDYLINQVLKKSWGFDGLVMSDWVSTYDGIAVALGGLDLEMPSGAMMNQNTLVPAVKDGKVPEAVIDDKIRRILDVYERFHFFDRPDISKGFVLDEAYVRNNAIEAARGGMVLLKNDQKILPINKSQIRSIALIGPNGALAVAGGGGSSRVNPLFPLSLLDAIKAETADTKIQVAFEAGAFTGTPFPDDMFVDYPFYVYDNGRKVDGVDAEFFNGRELKGEVIYKRRYDHLKLENETLWGDLKPATSTNFSARFTNYFKPKESGYYNLGARGNDGFRLLVDGVEVLDMWRNQGATSAKADIYMKAGQEYKIVLEYYQGGGSALIYEGIKKVKTMVSSDQLQAAALKLAKQSDVVVMAVGFEPETEGEGFDRKFDMPFSQSQLIEKVAAVNKHVIVVLNAGGNVNMAGWIDKVDGVLMAWYPGQEGNLAAAEILFGKTNPSGKLPASFEYQLKDNPTYEHYFDQDGDKRVFYGEGIFVGYRYWDQAKTKPRFPFGYGLSYTQFAFDKIESIKNQYQINQPVTISVDVKNTGLVDGAEVVQVYVKDVKSTLARPEKELKAFGKVKLQPGEVKRLEFTLNKDAFAFYNPETHDWTVEPGEFKILVGNSSDNILGEAAITLQ